VAIPEHSGDDLSMLQHWIALFRNLINKPVRVFWICASLATVGIILDGTALRLWGLHRENSMSAQRIDEVRERSKHLEFRIQQAALPQFIERAARDQFDLVKEGDLVFVFADEPESTEPPEKFAKTIN
jgi:cell division protein FtsB